MTGRFDIHPDDLIDRGRAGTLSAMDARRLDQHVSECGDCALELAVAGDFDDEEAGGADAAALARLAAGAVATWSAERGLAAAPAPRRSTRALAIAAAIAVAGTGAAAVGHWTGRATARQDRATVGAVAAEHARAAAGQATASVDAERRPAPEPPSRPVVLPLPPEVPAPAKPATAERTAADLLRAATAARRRHDYRDAERLYRELQRRHQGSRERAVSHVAYGRLLLDRLGDPRAAIAQFDIYLRHHPAGSLAEEARAGRALALGRLGLSHQEREAWQQLLEHHPDSAHGPRARRRLESRD